MSDPDLFSRFSKLFEGGVDESAAAELEVVHPPRELVSSYACSDCGRFAFPRATVCYWCQPRPEEVGE